jgi:hypothetical protein
MIIIFYITVNNGHVRFAVTIESNERTLFLIQLNRTAGWLVAFKHGAD